MTSNQATLQAGAARRDITPENGGEFFGYVRPDKLAEGVAIRLFAHALVLDDGDQQVALVSTDLGAPKVREQLLAHVRPLGFDHETLLFACTHTHAGPNDIDDWIAGRIGDAVEAAIEASRPAVAGWGTAMVSDANRTRSLEAHLANHGQDHQPGTATVELDPDGPNHPRSTRVRLLRVEGRDGTPIAAWSQFPVHPTAFTPHNTTFSADAAGVAVRRFRKEFSDRPPVALYASGPLGDLIPIYDDYNQHAVADSTGRRIAAGMIEAWRVAESVLAPDISVAGRSTTAVYEGQTVGQGMRVADDASFGLPFFGGGQNGPSRYFDAGLEGHRLPPEKADPVQGRKIIVASAPWSTEVPVQAIRVGDRLLLTYPGEPTIETARRVRAAVAPSVGDEIVDISVIAVANGYHGYFTTPEEYDQQHYEGGHTVFGKYTSLLIEQTHVELAESLDDATETGDSEARSANRPEMPSAPVDAGAETATLVEQPDESIERLAVVEMAWEGGADGRDRPLDSPFVVVEAREAEGTWIAVASDLEVGIVWRETDGRYRARYDVPPGLPEGTYRLRVSAARYELRSDPFTVTPSTGLRVRGAQFRTRNGTTRLVFRGQYPPPDPASNLRSRPITPRGGSVSFTGDGRDRTAEWQSAFDGWTVQGEDLAVGDQVSVPSGGVVDRYGNTSGTDVQIEIGSVRPVEWPPHIGSGGARPPAPDDVSGLLEEIQELLE